jgi:hypothetical protein
MTSVTRPSEGAKGSIPRPAEHRRGLGLVEVEEQPLGLRPRAAFPLDAPTGCPVQVAGLVGDDAQQPGAERRRVDAGDHQLAHLYVGVAGGELAGGEAHRRTSVAAPARLVEHHRSVVGDEKAEQVRRFVGEVDLGH